MSNQTVVVKYQTKKHYCSCCNQKLLQAETSKIRKLEFNKETALRWANWKEIAQFPDDMESIVPEFVYETISFYAVDSDNQIIVEDSEVEKVKEFIMREIVA